MSKGISIHIGLNNIKSTHYGVDGRLKGCENDADFMFEFAKNRGFEAVKLLSSTNNAKYSDINDAILKAKSDLADDGILLVTYSGHGGQLKDTNYNEADGFDETWCLYDEQMIDDEIFELLTQFKKGQRILFISDSCHSGTITGSISSSFTDLNEKKLELKHFDFENFDRSILNLQGDSNIQYDAITWEKDKLHLKEIGLYYEDFMGVRYKRIPAETLKKVIENKENKDRYKFKQSETKRKLKDKNPTSKDFRELINTSVILISACQDWQLASDGNQFGLFTETMKTILENGGENLNYLELHEKIWNKLSNTKQNPNYSKIGIPDSKFEMQACFTI